MISPHELQANLGFRDFPAKSNFPALNEGVETQQ